ncbi:NTP pyrophosphatase (non-canonical NTP hydrolase) [Dysgonomonas sp. PFB1-18]|uniref:dATP/dGTP pyrophosphohydrolase domain-containing protein n=1 Tax=unclassified Dysgonomonas TaxID=2630389 RepID=UPI002474E776|nr:MULTISPECIES: dATP/dGTP pyrophosphohydrolase domain-containing protein [unclassified Dysgonomonas]MDH6309388.1 NTP pyrophosphatase (non-canonical NTP hydrolase) [Dysgonomonas sp. PF1-14]MDH6339747.1 NTP pyrophosphatase (non-canonical NTP hydrolase) [Dysgonomonas sp. PF1-16]MDH6381395.1 NTP pyrophosphatase (non-canonical NTP hydrolase) [Dysgonomonas sp. PFB1-18]MDH6398610.1 NTP pyrophosphatase (non-canonical NTP hydrolase) [Dysgonomonas sp. PF1-23]
MRNLDIQGLMNAIREWSDKQFSDGVFDHQRALPITHHLTKEVSELIDILEEVGNGDPSDENWDKVRMEYVDCLMLLLDSASHFGLSAYDLYRGCYIKLEINKKRKWGLPDENGVIEHIRDRERPFAVPEHKTLRKFKL